MESAGHLSDDQFRFGEANHEGRFPVWRLLRYLVPGVILFLFFPFRLIQWIGLLAMLGCLISWGVSYLLYRGLSIRPIEPVAYGYRDTEITTEFIIRNRTRFPAVNLGLSVFTPSHIQGRQKIIALLSVPGKSESKFNATIRMLQRGEFGLSPVILEGSDPFGIFPWQILLRDIARVVVYPTIHYGALSPGRGIPGGSIRVPNRMYDDVHTIGSIREYIPGDDVRRIHWKASARCGELMTVQPVPSLDSPCMIMLDLDASLYPAKYRYRRIEDAIEIAATLVHHFGSRGQRVGLVSNGLDSGSHPVIPSTGNTHSSALALRVLARIAPGNETRDPVSLFLDARIPIHQGISCYIITPRAPDEYSKQLTHPTIVSMKPTLFHVSDKRAPSTRGLAVSYRFIDDPRELADNAR